MVKIDRNEKKRVGVAYVGPRKQSQKVMVRIPVELYDQVEELVRGEMPFARKLLLAARLGLQSPDLTKAILSGDAKNVASTIVWERKPVHLQVAKPKRRRT